MTKSISTSIIPNYTTNQERLNYIVECLSQSCPWTKSITAKQMISWLKSEVLELEEELNLWEKEKDQSSSSSKRIMSRRQNELVSEMGDILFDVLMLEMILRRDYYSSDRIDKEEEQQNVDAWLSACEKIERRTPYMKEWGDGISVATTVEEANVLWQAAKKKEKEQHHNDINNNQQGRTILPFLQPIRRMTTLPSFVCNPHTTMMISTTIGFVAGALLSKIMFTSPSSSTHRMK